MLPDRLYFCSDEQLEDIGLNAVGLVSHGPFCPVERHHHH